MGQVNNGREKAVGRAGHPGGCSRKKTKRSGSRRRCWEIVEVESAQDKEVML